VSDGSGDGIDVLQLWFVETVSCVATFKLDWVFVEWG